MNKSEKDDIEIKLGGEEGVLPEEVNVAKKIEITSSLALLAIFSNNIERLETFFWHCQEEVI